MGAGRVMICEVAPIDIPDGIPSIPASVGLDRARGRALPTTPLQEKKSVQQLLQTLQTMGGVGPLRELIAHLNYDPLNEVVSCSNWPEPAKRGSGGRPPALRQSSGCFLCRLRATQYRQA